MMRTILAVVLVFLLTCPVAMAYEDIQTFMPMAPEVKIGVDQTIAIIGFSTSQKKFRDQAELFASILEDRVTNNQFAIDDNKVGKYSIADLDGKLTLQGISTNVNKILDRGSLDALDKEIRDNQTGMVDESKMVEAGSRHGAKILVTGHLSFKDLSNKDDWEYQVSVSMKLTDVETSTVLKTFTDKTKKDKNSFYNFFDITNPKKYLDPSNQKITKSDVLRLCLEELAARCALNFSPWLSKTKYELEKMEKNLSKNERKEGDAAAEMAERLEFEAACAIYTKIYDKNWNAKSAYNLAVMYEARGDMEKAREYYDFALEGDSGNKRFRNHRDRLEKTTAGLNYIAERTGFQSPGLDCAPAGDRPRRLADITIQLFDSPNGTMVREIPGDREVEVLDQDGGWYQIEIRNTEFWVKASSIE